MTPPPAEARLANMISVPTALTAVIRLGVPSAAWAGGANAPLSAAELLPEGHPDPSVLERLLRLLASRGVFSEEHHHHHQGFERRFALTAVGRTLVPSGPSGASYADYVLQHHQDALVSAWPRLHEAVLDPAGPEAFARANAGVPAYALYGRDIEANEAMLRAMAAVSEPFMEALLDGYAAAFEGVANCYSALPDGGGKVIACEPAVPEETDGSTRTRALLENDIFVMTTYRTQGRERSEDDFRNLGAAAGFTAFRAIYLDPFYAVLEYTKHRSPSTAGVCM